MKKTIAFIQEHIFEETLDGSISELGKGNLSSFRRLNAIDRIERDINGSGNAEARKQAWIRSIDGNLMDIAYDCFHEKSKGITTISDGVSHRIDRMVRSIKEFSHLRGTPESRLQKFARAKIYLQKKDALPELIELYMKIKSPSLRAALKEVILNDELAKQLYQSPDDVKKQAEMYAKNTYGKVKKSVNTNIDGKTQNDLEREGPLSQTERIALGKIFDELDQDNFLGVVNFITMLRARKFSSNTNFSNMSSKSAAFIEMVMKEKTDYTEYDEIPLFPRLRDTMFKAFASNNFTYIGASDQVRVNILEAIMRNANPDPEMPAFIEKQIIPSFTDQELNKLLPNFKNMDTMEHAYAKVKDAFMGVLHSPDGSLSQNNPKAHIMKLFEKSPANRGITDSLYLEDAKRKLNERVISLLFEGKFDDAIRSFSAKHLNEAEIEAARQKCFRIFSNSGSGHFSELIDVYYNTKIPPDMVRQLSGPEQEEYLQKQRLRIVEDKFKEIINNGKLIAKLSEAVKNTADKGENPKLIANMPMIVREPYRTAVAKGLIKRAYTNGDQKIMRTDIIMTVMAKRGLSDDDAYKDGIKVLIEGGVKCKKELASLVTDNSYDSLDTKYKKQAATEFLKIATETDAEIIATVLQKCVPEESSLKANGRLILSTDLYKKACELVAKSSNSTAKLMLAASASDINIGQAILGKGLTDSKGLTTYFKNYQREFKKLIKFTGQDTYEISDEKFEHTDMASNLIEYTESLAYLLENPPAALEEALPSDEVSKISSAYINSMRLKLARNIVQGVLPKFGVAAAKVEALLKKLEPILKTDSAKERSDKEQAMQEAFVEIEKLYTNNKASNTKSNLGSRDYDYKVNFDKLQNVQVKLVQAWASKGKQVSPVSFKYMFSQILNSGSASLETKQNTARTIIDNVSKNLDSLVPTPEVRAALIGCFRISSLGEHYYKAIDAILKLQGKDKLFEYLVSQKTDSYRNIPLEAIQALVVTFVKPTTPANEQDLKRLINILENRARLSQGAQGSEYNIGGSLDANSQDLISKLKARLNTILTDPNNPEKAEELLSANVKKSSTNPASEDSELDESDDLDSSNEMIAQAFITANSDNPNKLTDLFLKFRDLGSWNIYEQAAKKILDNPANTGPYILRDVWNKLKTNQGKSEVKQGLTQALLSLDGYKALSFQDIYMEMLETQNLTDEQYRKIIEHIVPPSSSYYSLHILIDMIKKPEISPSAINIITDKILDVESAALSEEQPMRPNGAWEIIRKWNETNSPYDKQDFASDTRKLQQARRAYDLMVKWFKTPAGRSDIKTRQELQKIVMIHDRASADTKHPNHPRLSTDRVGRYGYAGGGLGGSFGGYAGGTSLYDGVTSTKTDQKAINDEEIRRRWSNPATMQPEQLAEDLRYLQQSGKIYKHEWNLHLKVLQGMVARNPAFSGLNDIIAEQLQS